MSLVMKKPAKIEPQHVFAVEYRPNPDYRGSYQPIEAPGTHGQFPTFQAAQVGAEKCKAWFNREIRVIKEDDGKGNMIDTPKVTLHDNCIVDIDHWIDGVMVDHNGQPVASPTMPEKPSDVAYENATALAKPVHDLLGEGDQVNPVDYKAKDEKGAKQKVA